MNVDYFEIIEAITEANIPAGDALEEAINKKDALEIGQSIIGIIEDHLDGINGESVTKMVDDANYEFNQVEKPDINTPSLFTQIAIMPLLQGQQNY